MGQWYWLCRETSEEAGRSWMHYCMVSMCIFRGTLFTRVSRSLAAYLFQCDCYLEKMRGLSWKITCEQWLQWRRRVGAFPDAVRIRYSLLLWVLPKHLSETTHTNMSNISWPPKCSRLRHRAGMTKIFSRAISLAQRTPFAALQITQCKACLLLAIDGCRSWSIRMLWEARVSIIWHFALSPKLYSSIWCTSFKLINTQPRIFFSSLFGETGYASESEVHLQVFW